jgi:hypothetical protein
MGVFQNFDHVTAEEDLDELKRLGNMALDNVDSYFDGGQEAIEVGSWVGSSALVLAEVFQQTFCIDHWQGNPGDRLGEIAKRYATEELLEAFCGNMGNLLFERVFPVQGTSDFWAAIWPKKVALVWIDGDHRYDQVRSDILLWRRHVLRGGILCGHDVQSFPEVSKAVRELIPDNELIIRGNVWSTQIR